MQSFIRKDIGKTVYFIKWDRRERKAPIVIREGTLTKVGPKKIAIDNNEFTKIRESDFCLTASTGSESDHYIKIFHTRDDIDNENEAIDERHKLKLQITQSDQWPIEKIRQVLAIINEEH